MISHQSLAPVGILPSLEDNRKAGEEKEEERCVVAQDFVEEDWRAGDARPIWDGPRPRGMRGLSCSGRGTSSPLYLGAPHPHTSIILFIYSF